jgi:predicted ATPase/DNA-binding XRE family transcriptional regulator
MASTQRGTFAEELKRYRRAAGLTQEQLAERAGLSSHAISALEGGLRQRPRKDTLALLAKALSLSIEEQTRLEAAIVRVRPSIVATDGAIRGAALHGPVFNNLPVPLTLLLGRERDEASVAHLLRRADVRLLTLTGAPGVGKTRLAVQAAIGLRPLFGDGVSFVALAPVRDPALVLPTIARTLGLRESANRSLVQTLYAYLRERELLLVLDNFEHLLEAGPAVAELLSTCPHLTALVTSRAALRVQGEHEFAVPPLALPDAAKLPPIEELIQSAAVALFLQRAQAVRPDFELTAATVPIVVRLCQRLDGLPLAIELAAARIKLLPLEALLERLQRRLDLLVGGACDLPERQRTLRAAIAWSYDLLSAEEQMLFRRLAVFAGSWTLAAAEAVCATPEGADPLGLNLLDGMGLLVDKSLVQRREDADAVTPPHFRLLETLREYALERLEAIGVPDGRSEAEVLRRAHAWYYVTLAERAEPGRWMGAARQESLRRLAADIANLRTALAWAREGGEAELGLRLAGALGEFWFAEGYLSEGRHWLGVFQRMAGLPAPGDTAPLGSTAGVGSLGGDEIAAVVGAKALFWAGMMAYWQRDDQAVASMLDRSLALARKAGDLLIASSALDFLGRVALSRGDRSAAEAHLEEAVALARRAADPIHLARRLCSLGKCASSQGQLERAEALFEESLGLARQVGDEARVAEYLAAVALIARRRGRLGPALALLNEGLALARGQHAQMHMAALLLRETALVAATIGQAERVARLLGASDGLYAARGMFGYSFGPHEGSESERAVTAVRRAMGDVAWVAAYAAGQALSLDDAIAEALRN